MTIRHFIPHVLAALSSLALAISTVRGVAPLPHQPDLMVAADGSGDL